MNFITNSNLKYKILSYLFLFLLVLAPILSSQSDFWDGVIIEYSSIIKNYTGIYNWATESTWFLQYWLSLAIILGSDLLNISYLNLNFLLVTLMFCILLRELMILANLAKINGFWLFFCSLIFISFPIWHNFLSSVLTFHLFCYSLGVLSIRLIHSNMRIMNSVGWFLLIPCITFQSLIIFLPCLSIIHDFFIYLNNKTSSKNFISKKTIFVFLIGFIVLFLIRNYLSPSGIYQNYYSFILNDFNNWKLILNIILGIFSFFIPLIVIIFLLIFFNLKQLKAKSNIKKFTRSSEYIIQVLLIILLICSAFLPYLAAGKFVYLASVFDWNGRHAILLSLPISLLSTVLCKEFVKQEKQKIFLFSIIFVNSAFLATGFIEKLNRQHFEKYLSQAIIEKKDKISSGLIQIIGDDIPGPVFRNFEANFLLYKIYGKSNKWSRISSEIDKSFKLPKPNSYEALNPTQSIFESSKISNGCNYILHIEVIGFNNIYNKAKNLLNINKTRNVRIISIHKNNCKN
jgi:hypothetical protein